MLQQLCITSLPYGKILDLSKLKAFADQKLHATCTVLSVIGKRASLGKDKMLVSNNFFQRLLSLCL